MKCKARLACMLVPLLLLLSCLPAAAENPFYSYTYDAESNTVAAPDAVVTERVVTGASLGTVNFANPSDVYVDENGDLYIVDTDNNRIVVLNSELAMIREITSVTDGEDVLTFQKPQGIYIWQSTLYVADTGNARIVAFDKDGRVTRIIGAPESGSLPEDFQFKPTKLLLDTAGRIFVTSAGFNMGLIELDPQGDFTGCLGANRVKYTPLDLFWRMISTEEQIERMAAFVPTEYNNLSIDDEDFLYVTTNSFSLSEYASKTATPVRKLNAAGNDILRITRTPSPYGDPLVISTGSYRGASTLVDICTLGYGMYAILDSNRCRVFVYNADGELLFEFGGPGAVKGSLQIPTSLEYRNGTFYLLDAGKMSLTTYSLSEYGRMLYTTAQYHYNSQYEEETALWAEIAQLNQNNVGALNGLGKAAYRSQDYEKAMEYFRLAEDRSNYSAAFKMYRSQVIGSIFPYMMTGILGLCVLLFVYSLWRKRHPAKAVEPYGYRGTLRYSRYVVFHPFDGFWDLKCEKRGSMKAALTLLGLACAAMAIYSRFIGFIFSPGRTEEVNLLLEALKVAAPLLLFCVCNWCVTSLMSGEGIVRDIVMASCYALTPLVWLLPVATILSRVLILEDAAFLNVIVTVALAWTVILLICANQEIHNYSMGKTIAVLLITLLVMVIVLFLAVLAFALIQQFISFIQDLATEISMRL